MVLNRKIAPRALTLLAPAALLSGCAGDDAVVQAPSRRPVPPRVVVHTPPPAPHVLAAPGLESVIGMTQADLTRQFGVPRLDIIEGDARKLQYAGTACVLDVYLYPPKQGGAPRATYVEARRATDAQDVDRAACVAALHRR